jgi:hypothetical protein
MRSEAAKNASRENGKKSRGPITEEGKRNSSLNARRHGLLSSTLIVEGESAERFQELLGRIVAELCPETDSELSLVESLAMTRWRQLRILGMETARLSHEIRRQTIDSPEIAQEEPAVRAALAFQNLCDHSRMLDLMNRYESRFERQYTRSLRDFFERRKNNNQTSLKETMGIGSDALL